MQILWFLENYDNDIKNEINDEIEIIPLNPLTEKKLIELKHNFTSPDEFLNGQDFEKIDKCVIDFIETWWKNNSLKNSFSYNGIDIAPIINLELITSLNKIFYKVYLIQKIISLKNPKLIIINNDHSYFNKIILLISRQNNIPIKFYKTTSFNEQLFRWENYNIKLNFLKKYFVLKISRKNFQKFKRIYENFWMFLNLFNYKQNHKNTKKSILLIEFNIIAYFPIIKKLFDSNYELIFLNQRRPLIWNYESLKLSKQIRFKQIQLPNNQNNDIVNKKLFINSIINEIKNNTLIHEKFSINFIDFWDIINEEFLKFCKVRFTEIINSLENVTYFLKNENIDLVLLWDDLQQIERGIVSISKQQKIPSVVLSHGYYSQLKTPDRKWNHFDCHELVADKTCVYGQSAYDAYAGNLRDSEQLKKIEITGVPRYDELFLNKKIPEEKFILFALSSLPSTIFSHFHSNKSIIQYEKSIIKMLKILNKIKMKVIIKTHPTGYDIISIKKLIKKYCPKGILLLNANTLDLLKKSDMVISFPSTIIIEGIMAKKPTVLIPLLIDEYGFFHPKFKAITILNNQKWEESINEILLNKNNIRNTLLNNQNDFLKYVVSNPGNASEKVIKVIDNLINYNT